MNKPVAPAFTIGRLFRTMPVLVWLPIVAAFLLLAFSFSHASAVEEVLLLVVTVSVLASGHALMRTRARRLAAEAESAQLKVQAELRERMAECEQSRKNLNAFAQLAAHVAHEVRNPLNAIMLNADLLEEEVRRCDCAGAGEAAVVVATIQQEAERLQRLTDEYLAFARPPSPALGHHSLNAVVDDLTHLVREEAARQGVSVTAEMSRERPCGAFDPQQMKQAALNLVRNAIQAMPDGGRVTLATAVRPDGSVTLSIADTGPGVPDEQRCRIFEPFYTTKANGTGLGLPLAMHIARDHGGDLEVENLAPAGARFTITLPPPLPAAGPCSCGNDNPRGRDAELAVVS